MSAAGDIIQGLQGRGRQPLVVPGPLQPGNERFPDFCLHGCQDSSDDAYCSNQQEPGHHQCQENRDDIYHPHHRQKHQHPLSQQKQQKQQQDTPGSPSASASASSRLSCISTVSVSSSRYSSASFESTSSPVSASTSIADGLSSRPQSSCFSSPTAGSVARARTLTDTSSSSSPSPSPSPSSPTPRSRRDKSQLHAARLQRSGSTRTSISLALHKAKKPSKSPRFSPSSSTPADALAAVEPPHDQGLTRMAFAEQQQWVKVQQKTFTKWYTATPAPRRRRGHSLT